MSIGFIIFLSVSFSQIFDYNITEVSSRNPELVSCWEEAPSIRICNGVNIPRSRMNAAVRFWERAGYSFGPIIYDDNSAACLADHLMGEIRISLPGQGFDFKNLAETKTTKLRMNSSIVYSRIEIQERKVSTVRVLEHEIGHALGWQHTNHPRHIMNRVWEKGGSYYHGITYEDYKEKCNLITQ